MKEKIISTCPLDDWEIMTDTGWKPVSHFHITRPFEVWEVETESGKFIECADEHILFKEGMEETFVYNLKEGDTVHVENGMVERVVRVVKTEKIEFMVDVTVDDDNHRFISNGFVSHNTTFATVIILHYAIFNSDRRIALLANKGDTAREILSRVKLAFEYLPRWLQVGVNEWNKGSVELENGSIIIAAASSSSAIRGKTCVSGRTNITVRNKETGLIETITMTELEERLSTDSSINTNDSIMKKFLRNDAYEILTDNGFEDFEGLLVQENELNRVEFEEVSIEATSDHRFLTDDGKWVFVNEMTNSISVKNGGHFIKSNKIGVEKVYDPVNVKSSSYLSNGIISHNCSMVYIDECAFVQNWDEFSSSVLPTLSSGKKTILILTSTPNGLNHFYYYMEGAKKNKNGFAYLEVPWYKVPGRDEKWKEEVLASIGHDLQKFEQEYECSFQGSTGSLISGAALRLLEAQEPVYKNDQGLTQYIKPQKNHIYTLVADVSEGKGFDASTFQVYDVSTSPYKHVCSFRNNMITPTDFSSVINTIGRAYNNAYVLVENNNMGGQVCNLLWDDFEYENLLRTKNMGRDGKQICFGNEKGSEIGIKTSNPIKLLGCSILKLLVEQNQMTVIDKETIGELSVFVRKGASYEADTGHHDDRVMPLVLFSWLTQTKFWKGMMEQNIFHGMQEFTKEAIEEMMKSTALIITDGLEDEVDGKYEVIDGDVWMVMGDNDWETDNCW